MDELLPPIITGVVFSLFVIALCFWRPNAGRVFLGFFFIAMGLGVNLMFLLFAPEEFGEFIVEYGGGALLVTHRWLSSEVLARAPVVVGGLVVVFEVLMGLLILGKGTPVKVGLIGSMVFVVALAPVSVIQIVWAGMLIGQGYLLTQEFDRSVLDMLSERFRTVGG